MLLWVTVSLCFRGNGSDDLSISTVRSVLVCMDCGQWSGSGLLRDVGTWVLGQKNVEL